MGLDEYFELFICSDIPAVLNSQRTGMLNLRFFKHKADVCSLTDNTSAARPK